MKISALFIKRRWLYWLSGIVILLLIALTLFLSPLGFKIALAAAKARLPGTLTYTSAKGNLFGPYTFENLSYTHDGNRFTAQHIYLKWRVLKLADKNIQIDQFDLDHSHLTIKINPLDWIKTQLQTHTTSTEKDKKHSAWLPPWLSSHIIANKISIKDFSLQSPKQKTVWRLKSLTGQIHLNEKTLNSQLTLDIEAPESANINLKTQGTPDHYQLDINAQGPQTNWKMHGYGNRQQAHITTMRNQLWGGTLSGHTTLQWQPKLHWVGSWHITNINPSRVWKNHQSPIRLPRSLSLDMSAEGNMDAGQMQWKNLQATLHKQHIRGNGKIQYQQRYLTQINIKLISQNSRLMLAGQYQNAWQLAWQCRIPNLQQFSDTLGGSITANGTLVGDKKTPDFEGRLQANQLRYLTHGFQNIKASWHISGQGSAPATLTLQAKGALDASQRWQSINAVLSGSMQQHNLTINAQTPHANLQANINGEYAKQAWTGKINQFLIIDQNKRWTIAQPANLSWVNQRFTLNKFCVAGGPSNLCANGDWQDNKNWQLHLNATQWPSEIFQPWLPDKIHMKGVITGNSDIVVDNDRLKVWENKWRLSSVLLQFTLGDQTRYPLNIKNAVFNSHLKHHALIINSQGRLKQNDRWQLKLKINNYKQFNLPLPDQPISGHIDIQAPSLHHIEALLPDVQSLKGSLNAALRIDGTWQQPLLKGKINIPDASFYIPPLGITVSDIHASINAKGATFDLLAQAQSAGRPLFLKGTGSLKQHQIFAQANVTGDNVLIWDTKDYTFYATPKLHFTLKPNTLIIRGAVNVPQGDIHPIDFATGVHMPSDAVIIYPDSKKNTDQYHVDSQITLIAGNKIQIDANGIKGDVKGTLKIISQTRHVTVADGHLYLIDGTYTIRGRTLKLTQGALDFRQSPIANPFLNIRAVRLIKNAYVSSFSAGQSSLTVGAIIQGTLKRPKITFFSSPVHLSQADILSYIVLGQGSAQSSGANMAAITQAISAINLGGNNQSDQQSITQQLQEGLQLNEFGYEPTANVDPLGTPLQTGNSFVVGRQLGNRIYLRYVQSRGIFMRGDQLEIRYQLDPRWSIQTNSGSNGNGADLLYSVSK